MKNVKYQYFVEGEDEKKLLNTLKNQLGLVRAGKVQVLNVVQNKFPDAILRTLTNGTVIVLVFDTDTGNADILNSNIKLLNKCPFISRVITVPQVKNLEDELVRSCDIGNITQLLNSRSKKDYKSDLIRITNLESKLKEHKFDISRFWSKQPEAPYQNIANDASQIKLHTK